MDTGKNDHKNYPIAPFPNNLLIFCQERRTKPLTGGVAYDPAKGCVVELPEDECHH
jgi:hypothetical protein